MAKIDTSGWKEFVVGDLFSCETTGGIANKNDLTEGDIPYITRSAEHNGLSGFCGNEDHKVTGNCITIGAEGFTAFYQKDDFVAGNKVYALRNENLNEFNTLYLVSALNALSSRYSFQDARVLDKIKSEKVLLPVTEEDAPDWTYMENYMKLIENNVLARLTALETAKDTEKKKIDTSQWKEFRVGDLFEISTSKSVDKINLDFIESGKYDFIGRTPINNGIQGHLNKLDFAPNPSCTFSVTQIGERLCQYRENEWYASQNIFILNPKHTEIKRVPLFFTTVITEMLKRKYGDDAYSCYPTLKSLPQCTILLPVTPSGDPDWVYMENYMRSIENKVRSSANVLLR